MNLPIILLIAFVVSVALGFILKINQGIMAMIVAFVMGCFVMGMKPSALIAMWPVKIFMILLTVSFFYSFATQNGTLDKIANNILYKFGRNARFLPLVGWLVAYIMSGLGAGPYSVLTLLCPIMFAVADKANLNKVLIGAGVYLGAVGSGAFPTCSTGAVIQGIMAGAGYADQALTYSFIVFAQATVVFLIVYLIHYFLIYRGYKAQSMAIGIEKPEPFDKKQRATLILLLIFILWNLLPAMLNMLIDNKVIALIAKYSDVSFIAIILGFVSTLMKLGDERKAIASIPWSTIIMVGGVSILVGLAIEAGSIDLLVNVVTSAKNPAVVTALSSLCASVMSLFSSTTGVVIPTLYPVVPDIAAASGISAPLLFAFINSGSGIVGLSPLSACGALILGSVSEKDANSIYKTLFLVAGINLVLNFVIALIAGFIF